jgi:hypothetical protein
MAITWYEQGMRAGRLEMLVNVIEDRIGPLSQEAREKLESCPDDKLRELLKRALTAESLDELAIDDFLN